MKRFVSIDPSSFSSESDGSKPAMSLVPTKRSLEPQCALCWTWWSELRETIRANFPTLILHFEAVLSVCGVLGLRKPWRPLTVVFEGLPGPGKSLVLNCVLGASSEVNERLYRSDKFSPASFVSQCASIGESKLKRVDLLPRIKNKVLITPELAPTFRGKREVIEERFSILARVLDGRGLTVDSGTHGRRGYQGDYPFLWLGATTYLSAVAFEAMASVGNRIFFFDTSPPRPSLAELAKLAMRGGSAGNEEVCTRACDDLLEHFFDDHLDDDDENGPGLLERPVLRRKEAEVIASAAWMIARLRARQQGHEEYEYRIVESLTLLAQGRAAIEGYSVVLPEHLAIIRHIAMSSARPELRPLIAGLLQDEQRTLDAGEVKELLGCSRDTALKRMKALAKTRVCRFHPGSAPKTASMIVLAAEAKALTGTM